MAKHPHDSSRPAPERVLKAIEVYERTGKIDQLKEALTIRQRRFAEEYVIDFKSREAAIRAGYSLTDIDKQAYIVKNHKGVSKYIEYLSESKASKIVSVTPEYLIQQLTAVMNKEGIKDSDKIRSIELLMKHKGMFIDKTEITGRDGEAIRIEQQRVQEEAEDFADTIRRMARKKEVTLTD